MGSDPCSLLADCDSHTIGAMTPSAAGSPQRREAIETLAWLIATLRAEGPGAAKLRLAPLAGPDESVEPPPFLDPTDAERMALEMEAFRSEARVALAEALRRLRGACGAPTPNPANIREEWRAVRGHLATRGAVATSRFLGALLARYLDTLLP